MDFHRIFNDTMSLKTGPFAIFMRREGGKIFLRRETSEIFFELRRETSDESLRTNPVKSMEKNKWFQALSRQKHILTVLKILLIPGS